MNKKGFTLVELLAVVVILALLLAVAVPVISNIIDNAKAQAFKANDKLLIKAAKNYFSVNQTSLPANVGDSVELSVQNLKTGQYITPIYDPNNKTIECSGYIVISKTGTNEFSYIPNIKCGDANTINSSTSDGLIAQYSFDDFQEPTQNLLTLGISGMNNITYTYVGVENGFNKYSISGTWSSGTYPYSFNIGSYNYTAGLSYSVSCEIYTNVPSKFTSGFGRLHMVNDASMTGARMVVINGNYTALYDYIHSVNMGNPTYVNSQPISNGTIFDPATDFMYIRNAQIEQKPYATPYVSTTRTGTLKDYSGHGYTSTIDITKTPKWVSTGVESTGAYQFLKSTDVLSVNGALTGAYANQTYSWGAWIKLESNYNATGRILMSQTNVLELTVTPSKTVYATTRDAIGYNNTGSSSVLDTNKWYHVFVTCDGTTTKLYVNGSYISQATSSGFINPSNNIHIGNWTSGQVFNGTIDDVRVYNRSLSATEVKALYDVKR